MKGTVRRPLRAALAVLFTTLLAFGGLTVPASAADAAVNFVKSLDETQEGGNTTDVFKTGGLVRYKLAISCSSLTEECVTGTISDVLDPNLEFVEVVRPVETATFTSTSSYDAGSRTVTIVAGSAAKPFRGGDTAEFVLVARVKTFPADNLVPGDPTHGQIPNSATAKPQEGDTKTSGPVVIKVPKPTPEWMVAKEIESASAFGGQISVGAGETVSYQVRLAVPSDKVLGNVDISGGTLVDHYPPGAVVVDAAGGVVDTVNHTITWNISALAISALNCTQAPTALWGGLCVGNSRTVKLQFPADVFPAGSTVTNEVEANVTYVDGTTGVLDDDAVVNVVAPSQTATFTKSSGNVAVGSQFSYNMMYNNTGNVAINSVTIEDIFPENLTPLFLRPGIPTASSWTLSFYDGATWSTPEDRTGVSTPNAGIPLDSSVKGFRIVTNYPIAPGSWLQVFLDGTSAEGAEAGDRIVNCATGNGTEACGTMTLTEAAVMMKTVKVHKFNDAGASGQKPGDEFLFGVAAKFHAGSPLDKAWVADSLPTEFEYVSTECVTQVPDANWAGTSNGKEAGFNTAVANCDPATAIEPTIGTTDEPVAGSTLLTWNDVPVQSPTNGSTNVTWVVYKVRVKPGTAVGSYTNTSWVGTDAATVTCYSGGTVTANGAPATAPNGQASCKAEDPVIVQEASVVDLTKWDKGPLENVAEATGEPSASCPDWDGFTRFPCVAQTPPNGAFEYRFKMQNIGNINTTDHVMYDVLPYVGDTAVSEVLEGQPRGTQWRPVMTGPIVVESAPAAASPIIEYSLSSDPCRPEVAEGANDANWQGAGCSNDWLTAAQVTDWSAVKSFRVKSFQNGATWLPAEEIILSLPMRAPSEALASTKDPLSLSVAWNSAAHRVFRQNADGSTVRLLAAEPRKVGIIVPFAGVSVGDYVWIDSNRDGLQDAGEPPVEGVLVTLKDATGAVVGTTTTNADGYYFFQFLKPGADYSVTFEPPAGYIFTTQNAGGDSSNSPTADLNDSDADPATGVITFTAPATGDNLAEPGLADNPGLDAGFVTEQEPLVSIGDYVWFDTNRDGQQTAGEPVIPNVVVNLYEADGTTLVATTTTGPDGYYSFTGLDQSTEYVVEFVKPTGTTFTSQNTGPDATDSDADPATGRVTVTTPASGDNLGGPDEADDPTIDAGLLKYNLKLAKSLNAGGPYVQGSTATFTLTPSNDGPVDALAGWSVTEVLPAELTLVSMSGDGYTCTGVTCVAADKLAAGATGNPITVTATVNANLAGTIRNVAYVAPHEDDIVETNPLEVPTNSTDTTTSPTDNDAEAELTVAALVSIGDYVWWDHDRDGQQTAGEPVEPGMTVNLYAADGTTLVASTTTDADGYYSFTDLSASTQYVVEFVKPAGSSFTTRNAGDDATDSDADRTTGRVTVTTPATGSNSGEPEEADDPTIDAGLVKYNLVLAKELTSTGKVYKGSTVTFTLTPSNEGPSSALAGWSVTEILPEGMSLVSMSGDGYTCTGATCVASAPLAAGASGGVITVTAKVDTSFLGKLVNVAYVSPSDNDVTETNPLVVPKGQTSDQEPTDTAASPTDNDAEAEVVTDSLVSIGDYVWWDTNRDGQQTTGEPAIPGVTVNLYEKGSDTPLATTVTDGDGYYVFADLWPGAEYRVEFVKPAGSTFTTQDTGDDKTDSDPDAAGVVEFTAPAEGSNLTAPGEADDPTIDAGLVKYNLVLRKSLVTEGKVYKGSTIEFALTPSNDGPVDALAGWSVTDLLPEGVSLVSMNGDGYTCDVATATCVASAPLAAGATGAVITVTAKVDTYFVGELVNIAYVSPSEDDIDETNPLVIPTGQTEDTEPTKTALTPTDNDAEAPVTTDSLVSIGDYVWIDVNRDGIQNEDTPVEGIVVNLYEADGETLIGSTTTDEAGFYSFVDLTPGREYVVEFVKPAGYSFTDQNSGEDDTVDSDADVVTGRVTVVAPASGQNSPTEPDDPTIDAGLVKFNLRITKELLTSGKVYEGDTVQFQLVPHNDGPADALAGWSVTDVLPDGLTLTSIEGEGYTCDLGTVTCTSAEIFPAGTDGGPIVVTATVDAKVVGVLRNITYVSPGPGDVPEDNPLEVPTKDTDTKESPTDNDDEAPLTVDSLVSIGDYVWIDVNRDGQQSAGEPVVPGVTVNLYAADGETLVATTTTDENGFYSFTDLMPGREYVVEFVKPAGFSFTGQNLGDDATDSDADIVTGRVTIVAPDSGNNSATDPDDPTIDAGLVKFNLRVTKTLVTTGVVHPGGTVTFQLVPHNDGPTDSLGGWSVTDLLPAGLTLSGMSGDGYTCTLATATCTAAAPLAAGADGPVITVTAIVDAGVSGTLRNITYVTPAPDDIPEDNPLEVPTKDTDTSKSPTDNDDEAPLVVTPKPPPTIDVLPNTGSTSNLFTIGYAAMLLLLGGGLVLISRRKASRHGAA